MDDNLPNNYDAVIVGTGLVESIIAAAISRIGKQVLHLDFHEFYGENWASFNLDNIESWVESLQQNSVKKPVSIKDFNSLISGDERISNISRKMDIANASINEFVYRNIDVEHVEEVEVIKENIDVIYANETQEMKIQKKMRQLSKRFNLDLCPKLLYSKGLMVDLLISSNVAKYSEFKSISRILTWRNGKLEPVPCSRADVFATKNVSVVEKRILVKILTLFANYSKNLDEFRGFENKTFFDFLNHKKLPGNLIHYILYAIAMGDMTTSCFDGVKACQIFLESLGRYGNTPFIFPMYGSGELPQCFCRLCAVFGGIYCLGRGIEGIVLKDDKCVAVISNGVRLNTEKIILSSSCVLEGYYFTPNTERFSRGILITDRSIMPSDKESVTVLQFPPISHSLDEPVTVLELGPGTGTCPENFFVVHLITKGSKGASSDLKYVIESLFESGEKHSAKDSSKPRVLWSFTWDFILNSPLKPYCSKNVKICSDIDFKLDYDLSILEAKNIFYELYPNEKFLPRAPDPDEIVLDSEEKCIETQSLDNTSKNEIDLDGNMDVEKHIFSQKISNL